MRVILAGLFATFLFGCDGGGTKNLSLDESHLIGPNESVSLRGTVSAEHDADVIVTWGDGSSSSLWVPAGDALSAGHQYEVEGEFGVDAVVCGGEFGECTRQSLGNVNVMCDDPDTSDANGILDDACEALRGNEPFGRCTTPLTFKSGERTSGNTDGDAPRDTTCKGRALHYSAYRLELTSPKRLKFDASGSQQKVLIQIGPAERDCVKGYSDWCEQNDGEFTFTKVVPRGEYRLIVATLDRGDYGITFTLLPP